MKKVDPCDIPSTEYINGEFREVHRCPYEDYGGSDRCRVYCGLGVDGDEGWIPEEGMMF